MRKRRLRNNVTIGTDPHPLRHCCRHDFAGSTLTAAHAIKWRSSSTRLMMRYLHTMVRVSDLDASLDFYCNKLGLEEIRRMENEKGRFTLVFLATPEDAQKIRAKADSELAAESPVIELTWNWDEKDYS